ncbi:hypothetical protein MIMGU_mgv1a019300mg [Erythranthe guttata]|uniref:RING-type E3 ubiquitin transferase n=1 Tax=Erythranthe guttata TaxID=4155 RepID=A0A022RY80_ERYGU|nr:PREDICTED: uncharacterized protein LOC105968395 [Erythranthe guttata]EYU44941.1 hypothetical protein MIMGU_mgv1a019300mg [Erythranthe guttata]|eukprot:XP_012848479.1 PREDICTED: uncharacterized protein LOC105968395 [Erythranthe guttata]
MITSLTYIIPSLCCYYFIFCLSVLANTRTSHLIPYNDHCTSVAPESISPLRSYNYSIPLLVTNYYTGGDKLLGRRPSEKPHYFITKSLKLQITRNDPHKFEALLSIRSPYGYYSYGGSFFNRTGTHRAGPITFVLSGFWLESSRELCMVGSSFWLSEEGQTVNLDAALNLKFADRKNPTILSSFVSGILKSMANSSANFDPLLIFGFPVLPLYGYSLVSRELDEGFDGEIDISRNKSLYLESSEFCSMVSGRYFVFEMIYAAECKNMNLTSRNCSPLGGDGLLLPSFVSLDMIQCSADQRKVRYTVRFRNITRGVFYEDFDPVWTLIAEGSWDETKCRIIIVACRISNAVDGCMIRLSLSYPATWTTRDDAKVVGHIWTNTTVNDPMYFRKINVRSSDENDMAVFPGLRYEYTEFDRVQKFCRVVENNTNIYPKGNSLDMKFDIYVGNSKRQLFASGDAMPISVGNEFYGIFPENILEEYPLNISYKIGVRPFRKIKFDKLFPSLYSSMNLRSRVEITAEGVYDARNGRLCMVGCRKLFSYNNKNPTTNVSTDCEIIVNFEFSPLDARRECLVRGIIRSTRAKIDPLYFEDMSVLSATFYRKLAKQSERRIEMEIVMALISSTFTCVFVGLQLAHVKRDPSLLPFVSLVMVVVLSLGHMIQLVLNFNASFRSSRQVRTLSSGLFLGANELTATMAVTMVSFLMEMRLLGLVWAAKRHSSDGNEKGLWFDERKACFFSVLMCICGVYFLGELRLSYAGLILGGFLVPQVLFNIFTGSTEKALAECFYVGMSAIRLAPHAYVSGTGYYYAKIRTGEFYSITWGVAIRCGIVVLAVIVYLQQRYGGCCIIPRRFRRL